MSAFFQENFLRAAKEAVGKKIKVGAKEAEVLEAQGFSRRENDTPLYTPILSMQPGQVYCPRYRGAILFLVACRDGGCALIKKISINGTVHKGPGKVSEALGLTEHGQSGTLTESRGLLILRILNLH